MAKYSLILDNIIVLLMNPNQYQAANVKVFFSMGAPASIHLGVPSDKGGDNQLFIVSMYFVFIMY